MGDTLNNNENSELIIEEENPSFIEMEAEIYDLIYGPSDDIICG